MRTEKAFLLSCVVGGMAIVGLATFFSCSSDLGSTGGNGEAGTTTAIVDGGYHEQCAYPTAPDCPVTSTSTGAASACDSTKPGDINGDSAENTICQTCVLCSQTKLCADEWAAFDNDPDVEAWNACEQLCSTTNDACLTNCSEQYAAVETEFEAAVGCAVCSQCRTNCNAAAYCPSVDVGSATSSSAATTTTTTTTGTATSSSSTG